MSSARRAAALAAPPPTCQVVPAEAGRRRFVPFFAASLLFALLPGVSLGALSILKLTGTWGMLPRPWVWTHGYAQAFGFLGLFVMGFAYHAVPRFVGAALRHARFAAVSLVCQNAGLAAVVASFLVPPEDRLARALWLVGAALLLAAALCFLAVIAATLRARSLPRQPFERWMAAGAVWLTLAAGIALLAAIFEDVTWHHLLWPAALYGFAGSWIFGAGRRLFGSSLGWRARWPALETPVFLAYQAGVAAWCGGAWPEAGGFRIARALGAAMLMLAVAGYAAHVGWRGSPVAANTEQRLYARFIHAGWAWLAVALATGPACSLAFVLGGRLDSMTLLDFSRHALGLGFATHLLMGIGGWFVPVFCGTRLMSPRAHALAWWLLNASLAVRALEVALAAGYWAAAWPLLALSGPPAVLAFALFAFNILAALVGAGRPLGVRPARVAGRVALRVIPR